MERQYIDHLSKSELSDRAPWTYATSKEVARAMGVHIQTLSNWRLREVGPPPAPQSWFKGRVTRYPIAQLFSWAYDKADLAISPFDILRDWLKNYMGTGDWDSRDAVWKQTRLMMRLSREFRPTELTYEGRKALELV